jgi:plasmid maintenance system killer protein
MQLVHFRHKGLRQLHEDANAKGVLSAMVDKLRKLLFALKTAETLEQLVAAFQVRSCIRLKVT